jgi:hypothetical protein
MALILRGDILWADLDLSEAGSRLDHLMRKAFDSKSGPLRDPGLPSAEREALAHLFAGAIGSYKNPHSHRRVNIDAGEAVEMIMLANHLIRGVEGKRQVNGR